MRAPRNRCAERSRVLYPRWSGASYAKSARYLDDRARCSRRGRRSRALDLPDGCPGARHFPGDAHSRRQAEPERHLAGVERGQLGHRGPRCRGVAVPATSWRALRAAPGARGRRGRSASVHSGGAGEEEGELRKAADASHQPGVERDDGGSGSQVLYAWRTARHLHALSLSDRTDSTAGAHRLRVRERRSPDPRRPEAGGARRIVDGLVDWPLGGRDAGCRRHRSGGRDMVRQSRELPQRCVARRRTIHATVAPTT